MNPYRLWREHGQALLAGTGLKAMELTDRGEALLLYIYREDLLGAKNGGLKILMYAFAAERSSGLYALHNSRRYLEQLVEFCKSTVVDGSGEALATIAAYIDLNPVRAGLVEDAALYPWSSAAAHSGMRHRDALLHMQAWQKEYTAERWVEVLLYSHPAISRRVAMAKEFGLEN